MELKQVNPRYVCQIWPDIKDMLANALSYSGGEYNIDQLKSMLSSGSKILLVADNNGEIKGAAAVSLDLWPNDHTCFIMAIGGRMITSADMFNQLQAWAKAQGCTKIQGAARESVERLWRQKFKFVERCRIVEKPI